MSLSVLMTKGKIPSYHFLPLRSWSWLKRQISVGSFFRARFSDPAQLLLLTEVGAWALTGPQGPQPNEMEMMGERCVTGVWQTVTQAGYCCH